MDRLGETSMHLGQEELLGMLEQQRGMLWVFGEIMKETVNISSFKQLMSVITDMLMGVIGGMNSYIWYKSDETKYSAYKVYFRSIAYQNDFKEMTMLQLPALLANVTKTEVIKGNEISGPLLEIDNAPTTRLVIPLEDFKLNCIFGFLVLEHEDVNYFNKNMIAFLETLAIFISTNTQNSRLLHSVSQASLIDPLTGTYNRRYLGKTIDKMCHISENMTVAVIDTDNFKKINDELGHLVGDNVLKAIAQLAKGCVKEYGGEVVRYGGDEFIILVPLALGEAIHILEEFRKTVQYIQVTHDIKCDVGVTLGVCSYPEMVKTPDELIKAADHALIRGKSKVKNRIVLATEEKL